jgi:hypothetical protein
MPLHLVERMAAKDSSILSAAHDDAPDSPLLRELLCVLLEVRVHVEMHTAQLDRVHAQLERLGARVSTLERPARAASAGAVERFEPAAAARGRALTLVDLSAELIDHVVASLAPDDELAAALACRKLRAAVRSGHRSSMSAPRRPLQTRVGSLLVSPGKLQWGVACAGAPLSEELFSQVAGLGDVRMLSWLRARGCPWPAADGDRLEEGGPCARAAAGGHLSALRWLHASGCPWETMACHRAANGGYLSVLQWLHANGCPWDERTCSGAAAGGHLTMLQWARANGCPWDENTCSCAALKGHLAVLQWARADGCAWDENTCPFAAAHGHLSVLQWLRANGCPWDENTCAQAANGGHLSVLQWAHANG